MTLRSSSSAYTQAQVLTLNPSLVVVIVWCMYINPSVNRTDSTKLDSAKAHTYRKRCSHLHKQALIIIPMLQVCCQLG